MLKQTKFFNFLGLTILKKIDFEWLMIDNHELKEDNDKLSALCKNQQREINKLKIKIKDLEQSLKPQVQEEQPQQPQVVEQVQEEQKKKVYKRKSKNQQDK